MHGRGTNIVRAPPPIDLTLYAPKSKTEACELLPTEPAQMVAPPAVPAKAGEQRRVEASTVKPFDYIRHAPEWAKGGSTGR